MSVDDAIDAIRAVYGRWTRDTSIAQMRADWDALFSRRAVDWPREHVDVDGVACEWIVPPGTDLTRALLYLHGNGFRLGSIDSHRDLMQRLALAADARVLAVAYRRAPEHAFPVALDDAFRVWRWLANKVSPACLAIAGDPTGGGLAVSTMLRAKSERLPQPRAAYLVSPWTDLAATGASYETHAARDPIHQRPMILGMARGHLGKQGDAMHPLASPLYADLAGFPPILIQVGGRETILDDSHVFADRAREAETSVTLQIFDDMIHVFPMFGDLPDARVALATAGRFLIAETP